ncbi:MAG: 2-O-methyltransferase NoeI [Bacteroidia bacterium]|nr:MAG: 2-O-methyltransferase NoeI [Bacteroidia bacterium]
MKVHLYNYFFKNNNIVLKRFFIKLYPSLGMANVEDSVVSTVYYKNSHFLFLCDISSNIDRVIISGSLHSTYIIETARKFLKSNSIVVDVGANIGSVSIPLAKLSPDCEIYSFEPSELLFSQLTKNVSLNHILNCKLFNIGLSSESGVVKFYDMGCVSGNRGTSSISRNIDNLQAVENEIAVDTIDSQFADIDRSISLIKIDVQGHELQVLNGGFNTICKNRPVIIFEHEDDYFDDSSTVKDDIALFFDRINYDLYFLNPVNHNLYYPVDLSGYFNGNILALPNES